MGEGKVIREKLWDIQQKLRAAKEQKNEFGGYLYRSQEDILHAVKPFLSEHKCTLVTGDEIVCVGERNYIKATAQLCEIETGELVETIAYAREPLARKGMDESQITGATSSYARKYALNGLFAIDDAKDADATNVGQDEPMAKKPKAQPKPTANVLSDAEQFDKAIDKNADRGLSDMLEGGKVPVCPICKGEMWDNRKKRFEQKLECESGTRKAKPMPAFGCKDKECKGVVWEYSEWLDIMANGGVE